MATKTITTYEHTCDLCGEVRDKDELVQLYGRSAMARAAHDVYDAVDICGSCRERPVGEVLDLLARIHAASPVRILSA